MGCAGGKGGGADSLVFDRSLPRSSGANKEIFDGTFRGKPVAVCVARTTQEVDTERLLHEVRVLEKLGKHDHIIQLLSSGTTRGRLYLVQERVEPIGYDLDRLVNQYNFTMKQVPAALMTRCLGQLASALKHMHACGFVHRDLKTENVLITSDYNAKLIDMGIACEIDKTGKLRADYLAPEICMGERMGSEVDCWGLGLILHQVYQRKWKLVDSNAKQVKMRPGMPCTKVRMEAHMQEAMLGLLQFETSARWSLDTLITKLPKEDKAGEDWVEPIVDMGVTSKYLSRHRAAKPPLMAFAAYVGEKHTHIFGRSIGELNMRGKFGATLLLIEMGAGVFEKCPDASTHIKAKTWLYFGLHHDDENSADQAIEGMTTMITGFVGGAPDTNSTRKLDGRSELLAFTLDFDCFTFPAHIGQKAKLGPPPAKGGTGIYLDLRNTFKINAAGIWREGAGEEIEWYPGPDAEVNAGDRCLVVRRPCRDGSTASIMADEDLHDFMVKALFTKAMAARGKGNNKSSG